MSLVTAVYPARAANRGGQSASSGVNDGGVGVAAAEPFACQFLCALAFGPRTETQVPSDDGELGRRGLYLCAMPGRFPGPRERLADELGPRMMLAWCHPGWAVFRWWHSRAHVLTLRQANPRWRDLYFSTGSPARAGTASGEDMTQRYVISLPGGQPQTVRSRTPQMRGSEIHRAGGHQTTGAVGGL